MSSGDRIFLRKAFTLSRPLQIRLLQWAVIVLVILAWSAASFFEFASPLVLPPLTAVLDEFVGVVVLPSVWRAAWVTTYSILAAFSLAAGVGILFGFIFSRNRMLADGVTPLLAWGYVFPFALLYPLFILWFGAGPASKVAYAFANAVFPIAFNTMRGLSSIDDKYISIGRAFGASKSQIDWHIKLGAAWPMILSGLRIGAGMATVTVVLGEVLGADRGLGHEIQQAVNTFRIPRSYALILLTMIVTSLLLWGMERLLRSERYE